MALKLMITGDWYKLHFCCQQTPAKMVLVSIKLRYIKDNAVCIFKERKSAKIRNRYNQAQHLTQDTNGNVPKIVGENDQKIPLSQTAD